MNKLFTLMVLFLLAFVTSAQASEYTHRLSLFGGVVHQDNETDNTVGLEYEFRPSVTNGFIGLGGALEMSETAYNNDGVYNMFGTITLHPFGGLRLSGSLGESATKDMWSGTDSTFRRYTVGYDVELGDSFVVGPVWSIDRVNQDDNQTFGLQLGFTL